MYRNINAEGLDVFNISYTFWPSEFENISPGFSDQSLCPALTEAYVQAGLST